MIPKDAPPGGPHGGAKDAGGGGDAADKKAISAADFDALPPAEQEQYEPDGKGGYKKKEM
jgi:hypothetical protein